MFINILSFTAIHWNSPHKNDWQVNALSQFSYGPQLDVPPDAYSKDRHMVYMVFYSARPEYLRFKELFIAKYLKLCLNIQIKRRLFLACCASSLCVNVETST